MLKWNAFGRGFDSRRLHHFEKDNPSLCRSSPGRWVFYFPLFSKGLRPFYIFPDPFSTRLILSLFLALHSLFAPRFSGIEGRSPKLVRLGNPFYFNALSQPAFWGVMETRPVV